MDLFGSALSEAMEVPLGYGFVRHVDLAESQQVIFQQSKLNLDCFLRLHKYNVIKKKEVL
ncbi:MAG: hypothetical protein A2019_03725 [Sulfurimonas sp. GWF2_37_8]|nr:MAG: hypothetical protein A2019_03725 [Sulfurimonas sp. GWF2_37_8]